MKKVLLSMFLVLILSGCSIDWNWEKDQKIVKLEKQVEELKKDKENDLFKKKQECNKYYLEALKYYSDIIDWPLEVFYSPKNKTCYVAFPKWPILPPNYNPNDPVNSVTPMIVIDWLTKEEYFITYSDAPKWKQTIKELKWE